MGAKGIEMSLIHNKVYSKIVLLISEMSRDKLFHTGKAHTSFSLQSMYNACVATSWSRSVEMGVKVIEMS